MNNMKKLIARLEESKKLNCYTCGAECTGDINDGDIEKGGKPFCSVECIHSKYAYYSKGVKRNDN